MKKKNGFLGAAIVAGVSAIAGFAAYKINKEQKSFTAEKWNSDVNKRYRMVDSLIRDGGLLGKTRAEVIDLLGINGLRSNTKDSMEYYLAPQNGEEIKILILEFDEEDTVVNCTACVQDGGAVIKN